MIKGKYGFHWLNMSSVKLFVSFFSTALAAVHVLAVFLRHQLHPKFSWCDFLCCSFLSLVKHGYISLMQRNARSHLLLIIKTTCPSSNTKRLKMFVSLCTCTFSFPWICSDGPVPLGFSSISLGWILVPFHSLFVSFSLWASNNKHANLHLPLQRNAETLLT